MSRREERWPELRRAFRLPRSGKRVQQEVDEEIAFHLQERINELVAGGMARPQAEAEVRARFGDVGRIEEECRSIDRGLVRRRTLVEWCGDLLRDVRYAVRGMVARPLLAGVIVLTLALGIGANSAIFSVVYSVLLHQLPYDHADRLLSLRERNGPRDTQGMVVTMGNFGTWTQRARGFASFGAYGYGSFTLTGEGDPQRVSALRASAGYWTTLHIPPVAGRYFRAEDDRPGAPHVVVLSESFWRSAFGGDRSVVGRPVMLSGTPYTVVGVAPAAYGLTPQAAAVWVPLALTPAELAEHSDHELQVIGRLRDGVSEAAALADLTRIETRLAAEHPHSYFDGGIIATPLREAVVGPVRPLLIILLGAVGLVLLIACGNVASLLLARAAARHKEIAIRCALGAGRGRIVSQLLVESVVLSVTGAAVGLAVAAAGLRFLTSSPLNVPRLQEASLNAPVLLFTAGLAVLCGIIFGLAPAFRATRVDLQQTLRDGGRESGGVVRARLRAALVVAEVSLALVLLTGAGLLVRSAIMLQRVPPGFDPTNLLVVGTGALPSSRYPSDTAIEAAHRQLLAAVSALPGVRSAALSSRIPIGSGGYDCGVRPEGSTPDDGSSVDANVRSASGGYFSTMGVPLVAGRSFTEADGMSAAPVVMINRSLAHRLFGEANAIGRRVTHCGGADAPPVWREVIGVTGDIHANGLERDVTNEVYYPTAQLVEPGLTLVVRGAVPVASLTPAIRGAVARVDPLLAVTAMTMAEIIGRSMAAARFTTMLLLMLGLTGLLLATVGIYGVIAYVVTQRSREIGIRMALGADARRVLSGIVRQGLWLAATGVAIGVVAALLATRLLGSLVYGVSVRDPVTFAAVAALLLLVAAAASWIPARRATRVDPTVALRSD